MLKGRLKDFTLINRDILPNTTAEDYLFNYIEINNVDCNGIVSNDNIEKIYFADAPSRARKKIVKQDIILSSVRPNLQAVAYIDIDNEDLVCSTGFNVVHIERVSSVDTKYMYYLLLSHDVMHFFISVAKGVGYPAVDEKDFINLKISLPHFSEQKIISAFLDKTTSIIKKAISVKEEQLNKLDDLKKSIIYKAVTKGLDNSVKMQSSGIDWIGEIPEGWNVLSLKRVLSSPLKYGANEPAELEDDELPRYIRITDFGRDGKLRDDTFKSLTFEQAENYMLKEGDILFARSGATVGKTFMFKNYKGKACFAGYLIKADTQRYKLDPDFLYYYTMSPSYESWKNLIFTQATIQNIGADKYAYLQVTVPSLSEQKKIVTYLEEKILNIDSATEKITLQIKKLEDYKKSLIHECVTGKRRITETDVQEAV